MNLVKTAKEIHQIAQDKGWWDEGNDRNNDEIFMLVVTELSEAVEADREDRFAEVEKFKEELEIQEEWGNRKRDYPYAFEEFIKDTVEDELADTVIRLLDYLYWRHRDFIVLPALSERGWSDNFAQNIFFITKEMANRRPPSVVKYIFDLCENELDIELEWFIKHKIKYNKGREHKHGGKKY